ncbi:unnamed protein product [Alopecurus aequalis]
MAEAAKAPRVPSKPLHGDLPDEIVIWEILVRLPPKFLLCCRSVCRAWRLATSTRDFLLAHHGRQPSLHIVSGSEYIGACRRNILVLDHRAADAHLQLVCRLEDSFYTVASCDGLLILSKYDTSFSICNPATRQHAPLPRLSGFKLLGMYRHRPTGEYRLLLHLISHIEPNVGHLLPKAPVGCYVFALGSDQPPRYISGQGPSYALSCWPTALVRDSLHWPPVEQSEMNYESEVWYHKHRVELSAAEIWRQLRWCDHWDVRVVSGDTGVLLIVTHGLWLCYVDTDGKLVASFRRDGENLYVYQHRLKQTLVQHTFFTALEGYTVNASPFICQKRWYFVTT